MDGSTVVSAVRGFGYAPGRLRGRALVRLDADRCGTATPESLEREAAAASRAASAQPARAAGLAGAFVSAGCRGTVAGRYGDDRAVVRDRPDRSGPGWPPVADSPGGRVAAGAPVDSGAVA